MAGGTISCSDERVASSELSRDNKFTGPGSVRIEPNIDATAGRPLEKIILSATNF